MTSVAYSDPISLCQRGNTQDGCKYFLSMQLVYVVTYENHTDHA